ncbi:cation diffusion facilitator family transporter [Anoxybacillus sp. LAT_35]|uniref:cation diffusion facilitator family transporter n=1 Tax=Anoxybacillus TaxID=150247 RepID=UPI001EDA013F|nr:MULTISPECIES: cation diffusion facilitator family transporter [Anoxybacillus]MCG5026470.1 cation diffusion facilitator family transporter [Anoxybacillus flavithermus]MCG6196777.1 cation diffusion facilitator family transporter [Anoxybacillus sp. LAT_38]MCG3085086.1 cation diffusion facilitator family transporter [Anoxybacillus sp. LAT27]MCG6171108.1 cation diffusion facilitator family transporter [Anoxybacillus sp. LAT_11]MCG6176214.1 cation diffusion facilitator family transporter [Anoxyba
MRQLKPELGAWVSIGSYIILSLAKLYIGYMSNSEALKADGWNNFTDILASTAILIGLLIAKKPRDDNHPYGHSRAEHISSLIAAFIMMSIGVDVLINVMQTLKEGEYVKPDWIAVWTAGASAIFMFFVYIFNKRLAMMTNSQALAAAAKDHLSDVLVSVGTVAGVIGAQLHIRWLDPVTAFVIGFMICKTAWDIFREASHTLTDGFDDNMLKQYKQEIERIDGVEQVVDIKGRMYGNEVAIDVTICVAPYLNVVTSHDIADRVEQLLEQKYGVVHAHVHIEPYKQNHMFRGE